MILSFFNQSKKKSSDKKRTSAPPNVMTLNF